MIGQQMTGKPMASGQIISQQMCTFSLAGHWFGVPVSEVQEVLRHLEMTTVPLAPAAVRGMLNLRGQIVTAIDLRRRLRLPDRSEGELPMNVVVRTPDGPLSLLVDDVGEVIEVASTSADSPPETLDERARSMLGGVCQLPGRLLLLLDVARAAEVGEDLSGTAKAPYSHAPGVGSPRQGVIG